MVFGKDDVKDFLSVFGIPNNKVLFFEDLEKIKEDCLNGILGIINTFAYEAVSCKQVDCAVGQQREKLKCSIYFHSFG